MKVLLNSCHLNGHTLGFHPQTQSLNHFVQQNKQYHMKVLLNSFHLNGHTLGFHPQTLKLEPPCTARLTVVSHESTAQQLSFDLSHTRIFYSDPGFDLGSGRVSVRKFVWFNMPSSIVGIYLTCCNGFIQSNTRYDIFHPSTVSN